MRESWKPIQDFPGYSVSNLGKIRNDDSKHILAHSLNRQGQAKVNLSKDQEKYTRSVGRLVANAFLEPHPRDDFNTVIFLDLDKTNARIDNLAWRTRHFAVRYHAQHSQPIWNQWCDQLVCLNDGRLYETPREAVIANGLLINDLRIAVNNLTIVFPTYQQFRIVEQY